MTTRQTLLSTLPSGLLRAVLALCLMVAGWLLTLTVVMRLGDQAPAALVIFPPADLMARLPPDVALVGPGPFGLILTSPRPGLARHLAAAGAVLILPAGLAGCAG
jgi:hypothetical protein